MTAATRTDFSAAIRAGVRHDDTVGVEHRAPWPRAPAGHAHHGSRSVLEQDLIESCARHLDGLRTWDFVGLREVRVLIGVAVGGREAGAPLLNESLGGDDVFRADLREDLVDPRQLRFADVETAESALARGR